MAVWSGNLVINVTNFCSAAVCRAGTYSFIFTGNMQNPTSVPIADANFTIDMTNKGGDIINEGKLLNSSVTPISLGIITDGSVARAS